MQIRDRGVCTFSLSVRINVTILIILVLLHNQSSHVRLHRDFNSLGYPSLLLRIPTHLILRFMYMIQSQTLILLTVCPLFSSF